MINIDYKKFIHIIKNRDAILSDENNIISKHINGYINYKNKNGTEYSLNHFIKLLSDGFKNNKSIIYKLNMHF